MSEAEYSQIYSVMVDSGFNQFAAISSIVFGYLVAGHLVGKQLPRVAMVLITLLYSLILLGPFLVYLDVTMRMLELSILYRTEYPNGVAVPLMFPLPFTLGVSFVPVVIAWVGSILYVYLYVRAEARDT